MGIGAAGMAVGAVGAIAKGIMGARQASQARKAIENYQRQELQNAYEGLSVSTMGADLQREETARAFATGTQALQKAGARALIGGLPAMAAQTIAQNRQIAADLDQQQRQNEQLYAGDQARIRQMQERREEQDLAGLGQQLMVGQQNLYGAIGDLSQAGMAMGGLMGGAGGGAVSSAVSGGLASTTPMFEPMSNPALDLAGSGVMMPNIQTGNGFTPASTLQPMGYQYTPITGTMFPG